MLSSGDVALYGLAITGGCADVGSAIYNAGTLLTHSFAVSGNADADDPSSGVACTTSPTTLALTRSLTLTLTLTLTRRRVQQWHAIR